MNEISLQPDYDGWLRDLVVTFARAPLGQSEKSAHSLSFPCVGGNYRPGQGIMVVGRATNGWSNPLCDAKSPEEADVIVRRARALSEGQGLSWVGSWWNGLCPCGPGRCPDKPYRIRRSAFWHVAREFVQTANPDAGDSWFEYLAWSNLYKIAPRKGGNPSRTEMGLQESASVELIRMELETFRPRLALFMVGWDWFEPFTGLLALCPCDRNAIVQGTGMFGDKTLLIVTCRPEGKKRVDSVEAVEACL